MRISSLQTPHDEGSLPAFRPRTSLYSLLCALFLFRFLVSLNSTAACFFLLCRRTWACCELYASPRDVVTLLLFSDYMAWLVMSIAWKRKIWIIYFHWNSFATSHSWASSQFTHVFLCLSFVGRVREGGKKLKPLRLVRGISHDQKAVRDL